MATPEGIDADGSRADLAKQLIEAGRQGAEATSAFEGKDLTGIDLSNQRLVGLRLRGSNLTKASFYNAQLICCDLRETNLTSSDFRRSMLLNCSLAGARVTGARFCRMFADQSMFQGLWWFDKAFVLQGFLTCGKPPIDYEALQPLSVEESFNATETNQGASGGRGPRG